MRQQPLAYGLINRMSILLRTWIYQKSVENYYQETGRAGRDGGVANAWMAYGPRDVVQLRHLLERSGAQPKFKHIALAKLDALLALCEATTCRRALLLDYFGETMTAVACGNCDICYRSPRVRDGTIAAQKVLSCVYRTGQRFDPEYLIDVLRGNHNENISKWGHDKISTFGIGKELNEGAWRAVFRQLTAIGYLAWNNTYHRSLRLTPACRAVLKGEQIIHLRLSFKPKPSTSACIMHDSISPNSQNL